MLHLIVFSVFGLVCVAGAVNLLVQRHPINSALSLVVVMGSLAVEYLLLGAEFVAAVQVIVYAGAIMVLFVFVIMLLNAGEEERTKGSRNVDLIVAVCAARLKQSNGHVRVLAKPRRQHAARRSCAHDHVVVHAPTSLGRHRRHPAT